MFIVININIEFVFGIFYVRKSDIEPTASNMLEVKGWIYQIANNHLSICDLNMHKYKEQKKTKNILQEEFAY